MVIAARSPFDAASFSMHLSIYPNLHRSSAAATRHFPAHAAAAEW
jgi:hypothetical protein